MGKWGKYPKNYNPKWEKEAALKHWIEPTSKDDIIKGKPQAHCKLCKVHIRAHHSDLVKHTSSQKHKEKENNLNRAKQPSLLDHGYCQIDDKLKIADLRLAVFVASHCAIKGIDHLSELLKKVGQGSPLENLRLHRTKCTKLLSAVVAPSFLKELVKDVGDSSYVLIVDEATDISSTKFMALCIRYFSSTRDAMVTDFLGLIEVTSCSGLILANALKKFVNENGLQLEKLRAVGTDGAPNMCGPHNSLYSHLKEEIPELMLFKCVCHTIDKCAQHAFKAMPDHLIFLLSESNNWFAHSAKRLSEYADYYKSINMGKSPKKLISLSQTRWLVCLPATEEILEQWHELHGFFSLKGKEGDFKAKTLAELYNKCNLLYLKFLKTVLRSVQPVNLAFEKDDADISSLYSDLRTLVFSLASRILVPRAIHETSRPGMLRSDEAEMLSNALKDSNNLLPTDRVNLGENFRKLLPVLKVPESELATVRLKCGEYIFILCSKLLDRLSSSIDVIAKIKYLSPVLTLAHSRRPSFDQLPVEIADKSVDVDLLASQWLELGTLMLPDVCSHLDLDSDLNKMDAVHFWSCVRKCRNALGCPRFKELAEFALKVLTVPISNAGVERAFSVMSCVKTKHGNSLQLEMLQALIRVRMHLKVDKKCCQTFEPTRDMLNLFNASIYDSQKNDAPPTDSVVSHVEDDLFETLTLFDYNDNYCVLPV